VSAVYPTQALLPEMISTPILPHHTNDIAAQINNYEEEIRHYWCHQYAINCLKSKIVAEGLTKIPVR
jgi:hypothetical protein